MTTSIDLTERQWWTVITALRERATQCREEASLPAYSEWPLTKKELLNAAVETELLADYIEARY